ncbi:MULTISPECIES: DUF736 domain-containing protein [Phyllobacteriaceae]|jgi:uncharacterized protein (DUF736 family)|uniref:DUF736 domain-containing protein n=1 Tax=Mesorhizobium hungaricum TaxID=1566387 RepID=A0A1C2E168_9HYPH|nr:MULTISPECIES: DUF736 domain-containing protein [Mesorhizobium]MBN9235600.1 DUF736 domain-containing protein [Mesorhizobium sp.]MDQ0331244.1 uncharacterized protein (DUF736 family) [Mesorhizobium sp. YL-MeA3-2017]OCX20729.1 hypothetical protein QV13_08635 [Mesorhizobium hungaricum]
MTNIGAFQQTRTGYSGRIRTLVLDADVVLIPANKTDADNTPDFRIRRDDEKGPEIGAAWKETGDRAGDYLSFQIDDPAFAQPIRANLFRSDDNDDAWSLHWNRPKPRKARS